MASAAFGGGTSQPHGTNSKVQRPKRAEERVWRRARGGFLSPAASVLALYPLAETAARRDTQSLEVRDLPHSASLDSQHLVI